MLDAGSLPTVLDASSFTLNRLARERAAFKASFDYLLPHRSASFDMRSCRALWRQSPGMQQYWRLKNEHASQHILLFQMGDFFEMFGTDAERASALLGIALTRRSTNEPVPMAGVPVHAAESYIGRLLQHGLTVAVAEQCESPDEASNRYMVHVVH